MAQPADPLPGQVLDALLRGNSIEAIKLLRACTGLGLKEAKDVIDQHLRRRTAPGDGSRTALALGCVRSSRAGRGPDRGHPALA